MEALLEILNDLHPEVDFETCNTLVDDKIIDSFDIVTIISEVNEEYDVVIPAEEIIPENFNSASALYEFICRLEDELARFLCFLHHIVLLDLLPLFFYYIICFQRSAGGHFFW